MALFYSDKMYNSYYFTFHDKLGYYYYAYSHDYKGLTSTELDRYPVFAKQQVAKYLHMDDKFITLEETKPTSVPNGRRDITYVKMGPRYYGKLVSTYQMFADNQFNVQTLFLERRVIPDSAYRNKPQHPTLRYYDKVHKAKWRFNYKGSSDKKS